MPYPPQRNIHNDDNHIGNAKRNTPNGIAGLDGEGDIIDTSGNQALTENLKNIANGIPGLDASTLLVAAQTASLFTLTRMKVGSFTRNTSLANGNQAITGVGFSPKGIIFIANITQTSGFSVGFADNSGGRMVCDTNNNTAGTYMYNASYCLTVNTANNVYSSAYLDSMDSNGFTLTWVKEGSPSGTVTVAYMAFR